MKETLEHLLEVGTEAAKQAGAEALRVQLSGEFGMQRKDDNTPATEGDKAAERKIIEVLQGAFPHHRLHGEEFGQHNIESGSEYLWVYDPIDGTWSYLNQETTACVNIALLKNNKPVVAVIYNPFTGELFQATRESPALLNGRPLPVTHWESLKKGVLNYFLTRRSRAQINTLLDIWGKGLIGKLIKMGSAPSYSLAHVAKGAHSVFVLHSPKKVPDPWDLSAGVLLVERAGGRVTDLEDKPIDPLSPVSHLIASTTAEIHEVVLGLLKKYDYAEGGRR